MELHTQVPKSTAQRSPELSQQAWSPREDAWGFSQASLLLPGCSEAIFGALSGRLGFL